MITRAIFTLAKQTQKSKEKSSIVVLHISSPAAVAQSPSGHDGRERSSGLINKRSKWTSQWKINWHLVVPLILTQPWWTQVIVDIWYLGKPRTKLPAALKLNIMSKMPAKAQIHEEVKLAYYLLHVPISKTHENWRIISHTYMYK